MASDDDHRRLLATCERWERLYGQEVANVRVLGNVLKVAQADVERLSGEILRLREALAAAQTAKELFCEALNDIFHVLISEFDRDPMNCVENYLPWPAEKRFALRQAISAAAASDGEADK